MTVQYRRKKPSPPKCAVTGVRLQGVGICLLWQLFCAEIVWPFTLMVGLAHTAASTEATGAEQQEAPQATQDCAPSIWRTPCAWCRSGKVGTSLSMAWRQHNVQAGANENAAHFASGRRECTAWDYMTAAGPIMHGRELICMKCLSSVMMAFCLGS